LGILASTGGEGAKQWMTYLAELGNRGVADVCIACCDGLKGLRRRPGEIWPQATVQLCVVHLVRASLRYASKKDWSRLTSQLRQIYTAPTEAAAEQRFTQFQTDWGDRYPAMIRLVAMRGRRSSRSWRSRPRSARSSTPPTRSKA
jgi:transposase-like protein